MYILWNQIPVNMLYKKLLLLTFKKYYQDKALKILAILKNFFLIDTVILPIGMYYLF